MSLLPPNVALELIRLLRELTHKQRQQVKNEIAALLKRADLSVIVRDKKRDSDKKGENSTVKKLLLAGTIFLNGCASGEGLGAFLAGFATGVVTAPRPTVTATTAPAPVQQNCVILPAGRNTVTGQSYGSYVHCR